MDMADVLRLFRFWQHTPPLRDIAAAFAGVKPAPVRSAEKAAPIEVHPEFEA